MKQGSGRFRLTVAISSGAILFSTFLLLPAMSAPVSATHYFYASDVTSTTISIVWHKFDTSTVFCGGGKCTYKYRILYATNPNFSPLAGAYDSYAWWFADSSYEEGCRIYQLEQYGSTITYLSPSTTYYVRIVAFQAHFTRPVDEYGRQLCEPGTADPATASPTWTYTPTVSATTTASDGGGGGGGGGGGCQAIDDGIGPSPASCEYTALIIAWQALGGSFALLAILAAPLVALIALEVRRRFRRRRG